jgi:hypothetical protein
MLGRGGQLADPLTSRSATLQEEISVSIKPAPVLRVISDVCVIILEHIMAWISSTRPWCGSLATFMVRCKSSQILKRDFSFPHTPLLSMFAVFSGRPGFCRGAICSRRCTVVVFRDSFQGSLRRLRNCVIGSPIPHDMVEKY